MGVMPRREWSEGELERLIQRTIAKPRVEKTQAADMRTEIDQLREDFDNLTEGTQKDCGADLTVDVSASDVNNLTYTVGKSGIYLVTFDLNVICTTAGGAFIASLVVDGSPVRNALWSSTSATSSQTMISLTRRVSIGAGQTVKVQAVRLGGGYTIEADNSSMTVQRVA